MLLLPAFFRHGTLIALGCGVAGFRLGGPSSTRLDTYDGLGWTPKPTPGILPASLRVMELLRRQSTEDTRSDTCGYVNGELGYTFTCFTSTQTCVFANDGALNCCDLRTDTAGNSLYVSCEFFTTCVNGLDLSSCSGSCLTAPGVRRCSNTQSPYCITYTWPDNGYSYLGCGDTAFSSNAYRSYSDSVFGQGSLPPLVTYNIPESTSTAMSSVTGSAISNGTSSGNSASTPVGAIVGGVIGGLVVIAACIIITVWLIVSAKKHRPTHPSSMPPNHPQISELEARGKPLAEAGSVPIVEAPGSFPSGGSKLSGTPFPSQSGGSSGGSPGQEGNFYTPSPPHPGYSFAGSGLGLGRIGDTSLPYPTLPADSPGQEGIGGPMRHSILNPADINTYK